MHQIAPFGQGLLKNIGDLPPHITYEELNAMLKAVDDFYSKRNKTKEHSLNKARTKLFLALMWETGGRVGDICRLSAKDVDFSKRMLTLYMQKRKKSIQIPLSDRTLFEISEYLRNFSISVITLNTNNPNPISAWFDKVEGEVYYNEDYLGTVYKNVNREIKASGETLITVYFTMTNLPLHLSNPADIELWVLRIHPNGL
ncbi:MAG: tyrosine-type recombinase/integrase [Candidatus Thermoplasmatota archaeon]|nr:tyrosine-type recombinase/integrase [Candidatus Thermoplasmatota archaeon]